MTNFWTKFDFGNLDLKQFWSWELVARHEAAVKLLKPGWKTLRRSDSLAMSVAWFLSLFHGDVEAGLRKMETEQEYQVFCAGSKMKLYSHEDERVCHLFHRVLVEIKACTGSVTEASSIWRYSRHLPVNPVWHQRWGSQMLSRRSFTTIYLCSCKIVWEPTSCRLCAAVTVVRDWGMRFCWWWTFGMYAHKKQAWGTFRLPYSLTYSTMPYCDEFLR